jgi:ParB/RepB/Spo0J family partition protein
MATVTEAQTGVQLLDVERITIAGNVRELDDEHVKRLAASIEVRGLRVPVIVRPDHNGFALVAGFHRFAAHQRLGRAQIRAEIQPDAVEAVDRGLENMVRKQLNPYEEAQALAAMRADGLSEQGAAEALGWSRTRVTARMRLLELPEAAQAMIGAGEIPLACVETLRSIGQVSPALLDLVVGFLGDGNQFAAERLAREPGWVLDAALRAGERSVFAAPLSRVDAHEVDELRLGKKAQANHGRVVELTRELDRYGYPEVRFADAEIDQARAAGVVIEFERSAPLIIDRSLYRELVKQALVRTVAELEARVAERAEERRAERAERLQGGGGGPVADAHREEQRELRELGRQAHGVNLDLGAGLLGGLSTVDPSSMEVARFFVFAVLGPEPSAYYSQAGERVQRLAMAGIRLVIEEFRTDATKTLKSGEKGAMRIDYGDSHDSAAAQKWLWRYVDAARTAGELYGRALVVIAAEQYASRLVVPMSQRSHPITYGSHNDRAAKALAKLAKPHLPASLTQLEKAVERAHRASAHAVSRRIPATGDAEATEDDDAAEVAVLEEDLDEDGTAQD